MKSTKVIKVSETQTLQRNLEELARILRDGGLVAFPTETVYGLGADALDADAVADVYEAKGRPSDNPLIVHIAAKENAQLFTENLTDKGRLLAERFWPGPLTLVVKAKKIVPKIVTAGLSTVALRVPKNAATLSLLKMFDGGLVGPSANISGRPSPTSAEHVLQDLNGKIDAILDDGTSLIGIESTVVDVTVDPPAILRKGGLSKEQIETIVGPTQAVISEEMKKKSPGARHRHYAPKAKVVLINEGDTALFLAVCSNYQKSGKRVGQITHSIKSGEDSMYVRHIVNGAEQYARSLFRLLREYDVLGVDVIVIEKISEQGIGAAVMDRMRRAAEE